MEASRRKMPAEKTGTPGKPAAARSSNDNRNTRDASNSKMPAIITGTSWTAETKVSSGKPAASRCQQR
jgi:hypothetical protein